MSTICLLFTLGYISHATCWPVSPMPFYQLYYLVALLPSRLSLPSRLKKSHSSVFKDQNIHSSSPHHCSCCLEQSKTEGLSGPHDNQIDLCNIQIHIHHREPVLGLACCSLSWSQAPLSTIFPLHLTGSSNPHLGSESGPCYCPCPVAFAHAVPPHPYCPVGRRSIFLKPIMPQQPECEQKTF